VPLPEIAAERLHALELGFALDAFGGDRDAERAGHGGDRAHDRLVGGLGVDLAQERAVDLQLLDRQQAQVGEARVAGAEIVDREAHPEPADALQRLDVGGEAGHQHALGDLELDARAVDAVRFQRIR
jgi:hypothetical protein